MSLWWTKREQLDPEQARLIEDLSLVQNHLVLGPPGSGKTNVLLRRAQFVRTQGLPNVCVLTFTRALTEFLRTGCYDASGNQIFPPDLIATVEAWIRHLYKQHKADLPEQSGLGFVESKRRRAEVALDFMKRRHLPKYDAIFVDEAQDLLDVEIELLNGWANALFFVGDDKQKIFDGVSGLATVNAIVPAQNVHTLQFHYRVAPVISQMADRILQSTGTNSLSSTGHYIGPKPGHVDTHGPFSQADQLSTVAESLKQQLRVYSDFLQQGDRIGIVVAYSRDRELVHEYLEQQPELRGLSKIIRARNGDRDDDHDPSFGDEPINILTVQGCKGLEFRALHWLFCDRNRYHHQAEHYYTVVTRAKTSIDLYFEGTLPNELARSYAPTGGAIW